MDFRQPTFVIRVSLDAVMNDISAVLEKLVGHGKKLRPVPLTRHGFGKLTTAAEGFAVDHHRAIHTYARDIKRRELELLGLKFKLDSIPSESADARPRAIPVVRQRLWLPRGGIRRRRLTVAQDDPCLREKLCLLGWGRLAANIRERECGAKQAAAAE